MCWIRWVGIQSGPNNIHSIIPICYFSHTSAQQILTKILKSPDVPTYPSGHLQSDPKPLPASLDSGTASRTPPPHEWLAAPPSCRCLRQHIGWTRSEGGSTGWWSVTPPEQSAPLKKINRTKLLFRKNKQTHNKNHYACLPHDANYVTHVLLLNFAMAILFAQSCSATA